MDCKGKQAANSPKNAGFLRDESATDGTNGELISVRKHNYNCMLGDCIYWQSE
jgi:hypothetical protein